MFEQKINRARFGNVYGLRYLLLIVTYGRVIKPLRRLPSCLGSRPLTSSAMISSLPEAHSVNVLPSSWLPIVCQFERASLGPPLGPTINAIISVSRDLPVFWGPYSTRADITFSQGR